MFWNLALQKDAQDIMGSKNTNMEILGDIGIEYELINTIKAKYLQYLGDLV